MLLAGIAAAAMLQASDAPSCAPLNLTGEARTAWAEEGFPVEDEVQADAAALGLIDCLDLSDPQLRDGIGYSGLSAVLRSGLVTEDTRRELLGRLLKMSAAPDPEGFARPFAVLGLSEIARTDRIQPWMMPDERNRLVSFGTAYLRGIDDYRGFDDEEGWRHGVAHGADLLLQLTLNNEVSPEQLGTIADAILPQVAPRKHAYIHGEPGRLARPLLYIAQRGALSEADWANWFGALALPTPMVNWGEAFETEEGLAQLHNTRVFALEILARTGGEQIPPGLLPLRDGALEVLTVLP